MNKELDYRKIEQNRMSEDLRLYSKYFNFSLRISVTSVRKKA
jgi:hypothetical protein